MEELILHDKYLQYIKKKYTYNYVYYYFVFKVMNNYYLNIPVDQWDLYLKHIVYNIYGIEDGQYKISRELNNIRRIEFAVKNYIPLVNSLPATIIAYKDKVYFENRQLLDAVQVSIIDAAKDNIIPGGTYYMDAIKIRISPEEISPVVYQLAYNSIITKFADLGDNKYIITVGKYQTPMIIQSVNNSLYVTLYNNARSTFDIDDGYEFILFPLNKGWNEWKEIGDITAPIQSPNII
jgi:hypothetical protein